MNKRMLCLFAPLLSTFLTFATEIKVAPLAVYDMNGNKTTLPSDPAKEIYAELEKLWTGGLVHFSRLDESKCGIPVTIIEANKISVSENADYLIYGYVKKNETNYLAEIKFYSTNEKKIVTEFFASDSSGHYERMLAFLSGNIVEGIKEISGINHFELQEKKTRPTELRIPVSAFYWNPIDNKWGSKILGIAGASTGLEFYPRQPVSIKKGKLIDFSTRLDVSWAFGKNKRDAYPLKLNMVTISLPVLVHVHFDEDHSIYAGFGFAYNSELMNITPKYEGEQFNFQNVFSFENIIGYEFRINKTVSLFAEVIFGYHMIDSGFVTVKPCIGTTFNVFKERR